MVSPPLPPVDLPSETATFALAARLANTLGPGDVLLLQGSVGAGKTALARALIHALRDQDDLAREDVPSPTFTLIQTYDTARFEIWHADLYRLTGAGEVVELGLAEAFETALCLIEWPDRLGAETPPGAATFHLSITGDTARRLTVDATGDLAHRIATALPAKALA